MSRTTKQIISSSIALCISLAAVTAAEQDAGQASEKPVADLKPTVAFKMEEIDLARLFPFSPPDAKALPKTGHTFLVVGLGDVTPKTKIATADLDVTVTDSKGTAYKPIAFGFAMKNSKAPFSMIGRLTSGDMMIVGPEKTFVGAIFVIPDSASGLAFRSQKSEKAALKVLAKYEASESARIENLLSSGRLEQDKGGDQ